MSNQLGNQKRWFEYIREHKVRYAIWGMVGLVTIIGIIDHDVDIWLGVRDGQYDADSYSQLYFKNTNYDTIRTVGLIGITGIVVLIVYSILIVIARKAYEHNPKQFYYYRKE